MATPSLLLHFFQLQLLDPIIISIQVAQLLAGIHHTIANSMIVSQTPASRTQPNTIATRVPMWRKDGQTTCSCFTVNRRSPGVIFAV